MTRRRVGVMAAVGVPAVFAPALGEFWLFVLTLAIIYALACLSLVVLTGMSGQLNLHVAALGLGWGAYAGFALFSFGVPPLWALVLAGVLSMPFAALVGLVAVRFRGLELAVATLAMGLIFERLFFRNIGKALFQRTSDVTTRFESSFVPMERPSVFGFVLDGDLSYFYFCLIVAAIAFVVVTNLARGSWGRAMRGLREREAMAETVGIPVVGYRVAAFAVSIAVAATAGALFASLKQGIAPDSFNLDLSLSLLAGTVIGGVRSPTGAVIGGGLVALLPEVVQFGPLRIFSGERLFILFGVGMVIALWRLPDGLVSLVRRRTAVGPVTPISTETVGGNGAVPAAELARHRYGSRLERSMRRTLLRTEDVRMRFGGVTALDGVSITIPEGEICVLIGPNGAGKSTLFNVIGGLLEPDGGRVYFDGHDVTELATHRRAALGIGRTFQTVEVFRELTVTENLMVAGHLVRTSSPVQDALALPASRRSDRALRRRARETLATLGLLEVADRLPRELPLGLLRVLEVGMALSARPKLLLLDEPSAGLDRAETAALSKLILRVRATYGLGVLLVEHDMAMVAEIAEHVYVLDFGRIIAEGTPAQVRRNSEVLEKYLGADRALFGGGARARR